MMDGECNNKSLGKLLKQLKKASYREMELSTIEYHAGIVAVNLQQKQPKDTFPFAKINTADIEKLKFKLSV